jgi:hypothetical protein
MYVYLFCLQIVILSLRVDGSFCHVQSSIVRAFNIIRLNQNMVIRDQNGKQRPVKRSGRIGSASGWSDLRKKNKKLQGKA